MNPTEVTVSRTIPAPVDKVFAIWMDPASPGSPWYGVPRLVLHMAVDGLFYFVVEHEGKAWAHYGRFLRIEKPDGAGGSGVAEYTWVSEATYGRESVVTIRFQPLEDETEITLRHSNLPDEAMGKRHEEGWMWMLNALADRFAVHEEA
jgi:uncharacterized protein YndB with AHSA1/START domain